MNWISCRDTAPLSGRKVICRAIEGIASDGEEVYFYFVADYGYSYCREKMVFENEAGAEYNIDDIDSFVYIDDIEG